VASVRAAPRVVLALLMALSVTAACGESRPEPPRPSPSTTTSNRFGAPVVDHPVDVSAVSASPCSLLTASELLRLGFSQPGKQRTSVDVQECRWTAQDQQSLSFAVDSDRDLLADTYRTHLEPVFVPTRVAGFPAVRQKSRPGAPNICTLTTGLGPRQAVETIWVGRGEPTEGNDACEFAEQATALVIRKLPPQR
jgi:hypothetical protein